MRALAEAEIDEDQRSCPRFFQDCGVSVPAHVAHRLAKTGDDQRLTARRRIYPAPPSRHFMLHRHRILADRDGHAERGAELHAHGLHRVVTDPRSCRRPRRQAAIQLADSLIFTRPQLDGSAGSMLVIDLSHRHARRRPAASTDRQRRALAHRHRLAAHSRRRRLSVTAQSATGTCHGPTIWSRWFTTMPVMLRSPMVMRKALGSDGRAAAKIRAPPASASGNARQVERAAFFCFATRVKRRAPSSAACRTGHVHAAGRSALDCAPSASSQMRVRPRPLPMMAKGQRSRLQMASKARHVMPGAMART